MVTLEKLRCFDTISGVNSNLYFLHYEKIVGIRSYNFAPYIPTTHSPALVTSIVCW